MHKKEFSGQMSDKLYAAIFVVLSGGFQDAYTFYCRGSVFANAQTGNVILLSSALFKGEWSVAVKYLIPLLSFMAGTAVAEFVRHRMQRCQSLHWRQAITLGEIALLFSVGFVSNSLDSLANAVVSFVCAMQLQTFRKVNGHIYASTMCIGNLRSGTEALCAYIKDHDIATLKRSLTYYFIIAVFALGAGLGWLAAVNIGIRSVWICCLLLSINFLMLFVKEK